MKQRSHNGKPRRRNKRGDLQTTPALAEQVPALSPRRQWIFRLIALVGVPLLTLGGLEAALRLAGYGYRTNFFDTIRVGHREFLVDNESFSLRFFPPQLMRWSDPILMEARKPTNTYRIFILGESAAQGDPEPAYGAGRYLEVLLRERYPGEHFEVVNVAITAINSNVILPIARECAHQQGNLWIIYMGNNEMVGPFGAATVFGARAPPWWLIRLSLAVQQTRVGQLLLSLARELRSHSANASWGGMQMFLGNQVTPDDPRRKAVYRNFQRNLQDILQTGLNSDAKIILNTVAVNLKDCPPLASLSGTNLPAAEQAACDKLQAAGTAAAEQGHFDQAAPFLERATRLDSGNANLQFLLGTCLLQLTNIAAAREHFQRACDDDTLPFRADSRINGLIEQAGQEFSGSNLILFDAVSALETNGPSPILGQETFYEHVHFNFNGNYRLARAWAGAVQHFLPEPVRNHAVGGWASQKTCERWLGLTDWNRRLVIESITQRLQQPPLSAQPNNVPRLAAFDGQIKELQRRMDAPDAKANARRIYLDALHHTPDDYRLHENFAEFLESIGEFKPAASEWQQAYELSPRNPFACCQAGRVLAQMGQWAEAQIALVKAVSLHPRYFEAWLELGNLYFAEGKDELALSKYERAQSLQPNDPRVYLQMGRTLSLLQRPAESMECFRHAIQLKPAYWEAHYCLGGELALQGNVPAARSEFETVIQLEPDYAPAHLNLGVALMKQNQPAEAARQFQATLFLDPTNRFASDYLNQTQSLLEKRNP